MSDPMSDSPESITLTITAPRQVAVTYLHVDARVRYWEDATLNGEEDTEGRIPFRNEDSWCPVIDLCKGKISLWPEGVSASVHYKICDDGDYRLSGPDGHTVAVRLDNYVPAILAPKGGGYGDYIILEIDGEGRIAGWPSPVVLDPEDWEPAG